MLHVALRAPRGASILLDGDNVVPNLTSVAEPVLAHDSSTSALITRYRRMKAQGD